MNDFMLGLQITGLGMGLVFLTLLVVMLAIILLNRLFRGEVAEQAADASHPAVARGPRAQEAGESASREAAAIALAIALERERGDLDEKYDEQVEGEVVTVMTIDPGAGVWAGYGRLRAMR